MGYTNPYQNSYRPYANPYEANRSVAPSGNNWIGGTNIDASGPYQPSQDWSQPTYQNQYIPRYSHGNGPAGYVAPPNPNVADCRNTKLIGTVVGGAGGGVTGTAAGLNNCPRNQHLPACVVGHMAGGVAGGIMSGYNLAINSPACQDVSTRGAYDTCNGSDHYCDQRR